MKNLTPELIAKAKAAKSTEELLALAKANNVELTEEEAKTYFEQLNANGAVSDDELGAVAGGSFLGISCPGEEEAEGESNTKIGELKFPCPHCKQKIQYRKHALEFPCPICGKIIRNNIISSCM